MFPVEYGSPRGTFGMPSSAAASTLFQHEAFSSREKNRNQKRHTDVLVEEVTRANEDSLTPSGRGVCRAHMRIGGGRHVHPVPLAP